MKYVIYRYAISIVVVTFYCASRPYRVSSKSDAILKGVPYSLLSLLGGCWAIPWGPIRTIQALIVNFGGGETILKQTNLESEEPTDRKVSHTYPNLERVKASIKALYKHFSSQTIHLFSNSISPQEVSITPGEDPIIAAHRFASAIVRHLNLPEGSILVNYRNSLKVAGQVELTPENEYLVELHARYKEKQHDIAAILAHEITHVFLYRAGLFLPNTYENEILTDTASVYLGIGWLGLNAYRLTETQENNGLGQTHIRYQEERLGYLTPEEFGYVLGKRSIKFKERINGLITNYFAKEALHRGFRKARLEYQQPPMKNCGFIKNLLYKWNKRQIINLTRSGELKGLSRSFSGYKFDISDEMKVVFECPVCSQKLRLPTHKNIQAHCSICKSSFECKT
ncbi:hypothetical protein [Limnofasciculus baicalensis]|uniref:Uncharacterized protein n=1 Tax=Limnofasciculus baicalensis BBK-W-15 TaxID=2699891 RepID=A0AAE3GTX8_9CYAN|nr:hypothetical protein [Limnofasciculus baicalensis]MCP2729818.1 hypothetical protein [Limnofasciculus baicalensis BBK-W-15]